MQHNSIHVPTPIELQRRKYRYLVLRMGILIVLSNLLTAYFFKLHHKEKPAPQSKEEPINSRVLIPWKHSPLLKDSTGIQSIDVFLFSKEYGKLGKVSLIKQGEGLYLSLSRAISQIALLKDPKDLYLKAHDEKDKGLKDVNETPI